jgi:F-type H+-transporting ATPase subunit gamma
VGAQLRVYRRRIRSVQSTKKITKAMELIAASRIAKAQARMLAARPYTEELTRALGELSKDSSVQHPMLSGVENPQRTGILIVTSDRGLAGGYNANALKVANQLAARLERDGREVERFVIGRKGVAFYNFRRIELAGVWTGFSEQPDFEQVRPAAEAVVSALLASAEGEPVDAGEPSGPGIDELYVVHTQFVNSVTQTAVAELVAPVKDLAEQQADEAGEGTAPYSGASYDFEPEPDQLIAALLPRYVTARIYSALLESAAAESAARRRAMNSASDNATELIRTYTRLANQARQAEITQEISEIVGGADALAAAGSDE